MKHVPKIISAVVGLALVSAAIYLITLDRTEYVSPLMGLGLATLGIVGTWAGARLGEPRREDDDTMSGRRRRRRRDAGSGPGAAILALAIVLPAAPSLVACSSGAIGVQADMIAIGGILAAEADAVLVRVRAADLEEVLEQARAECGSRGCAEDRVEHYRAELARREAAWEPAMECRATVPQALRSWQEGLETAHTARTSDVGVQLLVRHGGRFVIVYAAFQSCVARAAPDAVPLPEPPPELAAYAEAITGDRSAGGEAVSR